MRRMQTDASLRNDASSFFSHFGTDLLCLLTARPLEIRMHCIRSRAQSQGAIADVY